VTGDPVTSTTTTSIGSVSTRSRLATVSTDRSAPAKTSSRSTTKCSVPAGTSHSAMTSSVTVPSLEVPTSTSSWDTVSGSVASGPSISGPVQQASSVSSNAALQPVTSGSKSMRNPSVDPPSQSTRDMSAGGSQSAKNLSIDPAPQHAKDRTTDGSQSMRNPSIDPPLQPLKNRSISGSQSIRNPSMDPSPKPAKGRTTSGSQSVSNPSIVLAKQPAKDKSSSRSQSVTNPSLDPPSQSAKDRMTSLSQSMNNPFIEPSAQPEKSKSTRGSQSVTNPFIDPSSRRMKERPTSGPQSIHNPSTDPQSQSAQNASTSGSQRPAAFDTVSTTASDPFLISHSGSSLPRVMTSTPATSNAPRFSIRTLSTEAEEPIVNEEELEVLGLDEVAESRFSVTARQRKRKPSSLVAGPSQKQASQSTVGPPKDSGGEQRTPEETGSSHGVKHFLRKSSKFANMALLNLVADSSNREDQSVYDVAHKSDSHEEGLDDTLTQSPAAARKETTKSSKEENTGVTEKAKAGHGRHPVDITNIPTTTSTILPQPRKGRKTADKKMMRKDNRKSSSFSTLKRTSKSSISVPVVKDSPIDSEERLKNTVGKRHAARSLDQFASTLPDSQTPTTSGQASEPKRRRLAGVRGKKTSKPTDSGEYRSQHDSRPASTQRSKTSKWSAVWSDVEPDSDSSGNVLPVSEEDRSSRNSKLSKHSGAVTAMSEVEPNDEESPPGNVERNTKSKTGSRKPASGQQPKKNVKVMKRLSDPPQSSGGWSLCIVLLTNHEFYQCIGRGTDWFFKIQI